MRMSKLVFLIAIGLVAAVLAPVGPRSLATASGLPVCTDTDNNGNTDNDGDDLCDNWEDNGIDVNRDGTVDLLLYDVNKNGTIDPEERADKNHKDLFVEYDHLAGFVPPADALNDVVLAFANSPVTNPDGTTGIRLRVQVDEEIPHVAEIEFLSSVPVPDACPDATYPADHYCHFRKTRFGTAGERTAGALVLDSKRILARYGLHADRPKNGSYLGVASLGGEDQMNVPGTLGAEEKDNRNVIAGLFMHEFGHNLKLDHGGVDDVNCKPNYLSVLNYNYTVENVPLPVRPLDYSRITLPDLNEAALNEQTGVQGPAGREAPFGPPPVMNGPANGPIDWNRNGTIDTSPVTADVNNNPDVGCAGTETELKGGQDWPNLQYGTEYARMAKQGEGAAATAEALPPIGTHDDLSKAGLEALSPDSDGDGVDNLYDNCVFTPDPVQEDSDGDEIGDACESNDAPVVDLGPDEKTKAGKPFELAIELVDGGEDDPADDIVVNWGYATVDAKPGAGCEIDDPTLFETTITCSKPGTYEVSLIATDGVTPSASDSFILEVKKKKKRRR